MRGWTPRAGWPDWVIFCQLGYFWRLIIFLKRWRSPEEWQNFGLLFAVANLLHVHLNKQFLNMVCCRYFKVSKLRWFDVDVLGFQIELCYRYLGLFALRLLGYFLEYWAIFFKFSGHPANETLLKLIYNSSQFGNFNLIIY